MSDVLDRSRRVVGTFLRGRKRTDMGARRPNWDVGKHVFRLFTFPHKINEWDVRRGTMGYTSEDIGKTVDVLEVPVLRYYLGGKGGRVVNGLGRSYDCPVFRGYCETPKGERNTREKPNDIFCVNAMDMQNVGDGIRPMLFTRSEWLGQRDIHQNTVTYGILHLIAGYPLNAEDSGSTGDDVEYDGPDAGGLVAFEGYGESVLGPKGRDIVVFKAKGKIGKNETLLLDRAQKGGPVRIMPVKDKEGNLLNVEVPERMLGQVTDLLLLPDLFPGWASDKGYIEHPDHPGLVPEFITAVEIYRREGVMPAPGANQPGLAEVDESPDGLEELLPFPKGPNGGPSLEEGTPMPRSASEEPQEPAGDAVGTEVPDDPEEANGDERPAAEPRRRKKSSPLATGIPVLVTDTETEDGVEVKTVYRGKIHRIVDKGARFEVSMTPLMQRDARVRAQLEAAIEKANTNVFMVARANIEPDPDTEA